MAGISLNNLKKLSFSTDSVNKNFYFTDVNMDLHQEENKSVSKNWDDKPEYTEGKDLSVIHDIESISNSIFYILATIPGQRPLVPNFGCDLRMYIGKSMTIDTAHRIRDDIAEAISNFEPRIKITKIDVVPNEESHEYAVNIQVNVPSLQNQNISVFGKVTTLGTFERI